MLAWESSFKKGPYPLEAKAMKGAGYGKGFTFYHVDDSSFLSRIHDFLTDRISTLAQTLQLGMIRTESSVISALKAKILEQEGEIEWLKSKSALTQTVTSGLWSMMEEQSVSQKLSVIPRREIMISSKSSRIS